MDEIYEKHIGPMESKLIRATWRVLADEQDVGDSLQDALTHIWKHRWQLESHPNPSAWMMRIALNAAYDRLRLRRMSRAKWHQAVGPRHCQCVAHAKLLEDRAATLPAPSACRFVDSINVENRAVVVDR